MTDGISLGSATLGLGADLVPLRADLADAKARVATAVAEMQALLDKLHVGTRGGLLATSIAAPLADHQQTLGLWATAQDAALADVRKSIGETDKAYADMGVAAQLSADVQVAASARVIKAYAAQAAAARAAADVEEAAAGRAAIARSILGGVGGRDVVPLQGNSSRVILASRGGDPGAFSGHTAIWGVRGATPPPFSTSNPGVVVVEAASRTPLGGLAAAIGEDSAGGGPESTTVATERSNQRTIIASSGGERSTSQEPGVAPVIGLDAQRQQVMEGSLARALADLEAAQRPSGPTETVTAAGITEREDSAARATGSAVSDALVAELLRKNLGPGQRAKGGAAYQAAYEALGYTVASHVAGGPARLYAAGGEPGTGNYGLTTEAALVSAQKAADAKAEADLLAAVLGEPYGAGSVGVPGLGPRSGLSALGLDMTAAQAALYEPAKAAAGAAGGAGGRGGGGGFPPWLTALLWGHGGGGGGGGGYSGAGTGLIGHAIFGAAGLGAGMGSLGSFAGFGPEHIVLTIGGIAGSGVAALGGGALLGAGALGKLAAGGGADLGVSSSAIADTTTLYKAVEKLREAEAQYGKSSKQAAEAREELNNAMKYELSGTKGVEAELHLAEQVSTLNKTWDKETSGARVAFVKLVEPLVEIATKWIPLINTAATQNFTAMRRGLQPFFEFLKGPEAMGIFLELESEFRNQIPTAMKALDEGFQFFAKTVAYTAPLTGGFLRDLDRFFTKWNTPSEFSVWEGEMNKLITDFHVWGAFVKILGDDLVDLFDKDAHTGEGIIETLTHMLDKVHEYENSVAGGAALHNIFVVHKAEAIALLEALGPLIAAFSHVYTTVSPPLVEAVTDIAEAFTKVVTAVEKTGPLGTWLIGLGLIAAKLKLLVPLLKAAGVETGILTAEEDKNAAAGGLDAAAQGGLAGTAGVAGGSVYERAVAATEGSDMLAEGGLLAGAGGLLTKSTLLKAGIYGVGGLVAGSLAASAVGAKGTLASAFGDAGAGAGIGFAAGGPLGAGIGALIGAGTPILIEGISDLFSSGEPAFKAEAERTASSVNALSKGLLGSKPREGAIDRLLVEAHEAGQLRPGLVATGRGGAGTVVVPRDPAEQTREYRKAGEEAGKEYVEAFQHVRFPTRLGFLTSVEHELGKLPQQAQGAAAKTMLAYAAKLESEGRLPKGAVAGFVTALEQKFSGLTAYLESHGAATSAALAKAYELTHAKQTVTEGLTEIEQAFGVSFKHTETGTENALRFLQTIFANNKGPMGERARELISELTPAFETEWKAARELNAKEIANVNKELNSEIKELGGSEIRAGFGGQTPVGKAPTSKGINLREGLAQGGLLQIGMPGAAGRDTIGLNVGGLPIAVGAGEQVAVFNRHQQPIVNAALSAMGYGGLPGLFGAVSTPNYMASGGLIGGVVAAGLSDVRKAGHSRLSALTPGGGGSGAGAGLTGHFSGDWVQVMRAIAKQEGWSLADWEKVVARESGGVVSIKNPKSTAFGLGQLEDMNWPLYGGGPGSSGVEQIIAMARYMKATYDGPSGAWASEMSRGFYTLGGLLGFAGGGIVPPGVKGHHLQPLSGSGRKVSTGFGHGARKNPKGAKTPHHYSGPLTLPWNPSENKNLSELGALLETTLPVAQESYGNLGSQFSLNEYGSGSLSFVITEGPLGETITPHEDPANVQGRLGQLHALFGAESEYRTLLISAQGRLGGINAWIAAQMNERHRQIKKLQERIKKIRAQIEANLKKLAQLEKARENARTKNKAAIQALEGQIESAENAAHPNHTHIASMRAQLRVLRGEESASGLEAQIKGLRTDNKRLGGDETAIGSHGELGPLETSRETMQKQLSTLGERRSTLTGDLQGIQGIGGAGGSLAETAITLAGLNKQIGELSPESLAVQVARAVAQGGGSGGESALQLAERELVQSEERTQLAKSELLISNQALSVFGGSGDIGVGGKNAFAAAAARGMLIPASWIPSFDMGGVVPGPAGSPMLATVHGGEEVLTPEQRGGTHHHWEINTLHPADPQTLRAIGDASTRGQRLQGNRIAKRLVPGI